MIKILIPVTAIVTLIALVGIFSYTVGMTNDIKEGNFKEASNKTAEYIVEEVEDEVTNVLLAPFIP
ncbi:unnamed protein product, partial [marine sediment metagenome]